MKTNQLLYALALAALLLISCDKNELVVDSDFSRIESQDHKSETSNNLSDLFKVAKIISEMGLTHNMVAEIKANVDNSLAKGYDEEITFRDILSPIAENRFMRTNQAKSKSEFAEKMTQKIAELKFRSSNDIDLLLERLVSNGINLYWPYSENWDGITVPVIAISPENDDEEVCVAYKMIETKEGYILDEQIFVDEDYAIQNPVWVINYSEVIDSPDIKDTPRERVIETEARSTNVGKEIKTVYLGSFQSTKQHDPWHKGGSEYYVEASAPTHEIVNGKVQIIKNDIFKSRITFTRKEISAKTTRNFGFSLPIVTQWQSELDNIAVFIFENDASLFGSSVDIDLSATWKGKTYGFKVKLPFGSGDDEIAKLTYSRDFLFSTNNYENNIWTKYTSDGVYWTLPFKVGTVIM